MDFWDRFEDVRRRTDVLAHPFYLRWSAGELSAEELGRYAGEYRHAVVALADAAALAVRAAEPGLSARLRAHAAEEHAHVELWDRFARATGADLARAPLPETERCARTWAGEPDRPLLESLVALYAIEAAQPAISQTKLDGLRAFYAVEETEYFEVHIERDVEHAREGRELVSERLQGADEDRLLDVAHDMLAANWRLLDGVQRVGSAIC